MTKIFLTKMMKSRLWSVPTTKANTKMMKRLIVAGSKDKGKDKDDEKVDCGRFQLELWIGF